MQHCCSDVHECRTARAAAVDRGEHIGCPGSFSQEICRPHRESPYEGDHLLRWCGQRTQQAHPAADHQLCTGHAGQQRDLGIPLLGGQRRPQLKGPAPVVVARHVLLRQVQLQGAACLRETATQAAELRPPAGLNRRREPEIGRHTEVVPQCREVEARHPHPAVRA